MSATRRLAGHSETRGPRHPVLRDCCVCDKQHKAGRRYWSAAIPSDRCAVLRIPLHPGDLLRLDNTVVLHGRTAFTDAPEPHARRRCRPACGVGFSCGAIAAVP
ncbi:TauD/TfdA family dioxygenase [Streptomyces luteireticuli]|uniref:TauD/TfdA family dioxygenase n=1 Tax=Streptomyces luteireticuli TaxID=173858 RepID=UPI003556816F